MPRISTRERFKSTSLCCGVCCASCSCWHCTYCNFCALKTQSSKPGVTHTLFYRKQRKYFLWLRNISTLRLDFFAMQFTYKTLLLFEAFNAFCYSGISVLLCGRFLIVTFFHWEDQYMVWSGFFLIMCKSFCLVSFAGGMNWEVVLFPLDACRY